ncbi:unnamed protein product [Pseudo-nitzschia multistriata]|uniref:Cytochrome b5 heme-binding domain-containing protein n=1 Tax=Pseudo-nitzschia multistriata TaxID=183589 RepID=A0A448YYK3_9STRA|nr:unnamed protein product [Pseudo-nitzschia multistriata]
MFARLLLIVGIPILSITIGVTQRESINVFLMGFFRDLGRIKANQRRHKQTSNAMVDPDQAKYTSWDILLGRDDPLEGIDFSGNAGSHDSPADSDSDNGSASDTTFTLKELEEFGNGRNGNPIYLSVFGRVYDVSKGTKFYGPDANYNMFAGKDVTRALCLGRKEAEFLVRSTEGLDEKQIEEGKRWLSFFELHDTYRFVGSLETLDSEAWLDALLDEDEDEDDDDDDDYDDERDGEEDDDSIEGDRKGEDDDDDDDDDGFQQRIKA